MLKRKGMIDTTLKKIHDAESRAEATGYHDPYVHTTDEFPSRLPDDYSFPTKSPDDYSFPPGYSWPDNDSLFKYSITEKRIRSAFDYNDVQLIPKKGILRSGKDARTSVCFGGQTWKLPVLPANMSSVVNADLCLKLAATQYLYCMHRFCTNEERYQFAKDIYTQRCPLSMAFGISESEFELAKKLEKGGYHIHLLWIDVAHGYADYMKTAIKKYRKICKKAFIIAGNVADVEGAKFLEECGADAVKLGIGHGEACITRLKTGFSNYNWQLSALEEAASEINIPIVCDGGVHEHGDIVKAIVMGATICMAGSMFSALIDSPGNIIIKDGVEYKEYFGSASARQKKNGTNQPVNVEGKCILKPLKDHSILTELEWIQEDLQSAISYAGGKDLSSLINVEYIITKG